MLKRWLLLTITASLHEARAQEESNQGNEPGMTENERAENGMAENSALNPVWDPAAGAWVISSRDVFPSMTTPTVWLPNGAVVPSGASGGNDFYYAQPVVRFAHVPGANNE
eukprot:g16013.t1